MQRRTMRRYTGRFWRDTHTRNARRAMHAAWQHAVEGILRRAIADRQVRPDLARLTSHPADEILSFMVNYQARLGRTLAALAHPEEAAAKTHKGGS
jgi:hypothetical protein